MRRKKDKSNGITALYERHNMRNLWMNYRRTSWHRPPPMTSIFRTNMSLKCLDRKCLWSVIC